MNASYVLYASYIGTACVVTMGIIMLVVLIAASLDKTQRKRFVDDAQDSDGIVRFWNCLRPFACTALLLSVFALCCDTYGLEGLQTMSTTLKTVSCETMVLGIIAYAFVESCYRKTKRAAKR